MEAVERGMPKSEAARLFSVNLSSVKRYARTARQGCSFAPKERPGRPPKINESAKQLLEADMEERPAASVSDRRRFLAGLTGMQLSDSTVWRLWKRLGLKPKKGLWALERDEFLRCAWRVMVAQELDSRQLVFVDEMGTNTSLTAVYAWAPKGQRAHCSVPRNRGANTTLLLSMSMGGMGPSLAVVGSTTARVFEAYVEQILAPTLKRGQVVVMDNLTAHKGERVKELIERRGCELLYLPPYSPDFNPIEEAFSKIKSLLRKAEARTREALLEAIGRAISAVSARDAGGFFEHCGYGTPAQSLYDERCTRVHAWINGRLSEAPSQ